MSKIIMFFLISSPLVDYAYKIKFLSLWGFDLSPNRIFKFIPIVIFLLCLSLERKNVFIWKYPFFLLIFSSISLFLGILSFPSESLDVYIRFISSFIFIFLSGKLLNDEDIILTLKIVTILTLIPITISYLQFLQVIPYTDFDYISGIQVGRVSGGYEKQVAMMSYLFYSFSFVLFYFFNSGRALIKFFCVIYIISVLGVVVLSTHRASIIVFTIILTYFAYRYNKRYLIALIVIFSIFILQNNELLKMFFINNIDIGTGDWTFRGRTGFWQDYIYNLINSGIISIIIGKGHSVLDTLNAQHLPFLWDEPHSDIIRIIYQYGFVGFLLFFYILGISIYKSFRFRNITFTIQQRLISDIGIIIGFSLLMYSITIEPTRYPAFWWYYSAIISYILVNWSKFKNESSIYN